MIENGLILAEAGAYVPPNPEDMHLPPFFTIGDFAFGKQNVLVLLSVVIIAVFFLTAARKRAMVPGKTRFKFSPSSGITPATLCKKACVLTGCKIISAP